MSARSARLARRDFLKTSAVGFAGYWLGTSRARGAESVHDKLNLACIGVGGQGASNVNGCKSQNLVAMCDLDEERAAKSFEAFPAAKKFTDFRKMFDEIGGQLDGVVISTPDHTHFHPAWWAIERGKHVYLEKPMAHSVWEVRELTRFAAEKKVSTQLGVQRHTLPHLREAVEILQSGALGVIKECHAWVDSERGMPDKPTEAETAPKSLDWDLWLGPAAYRPYSRAYAPYNWRFWWDFGTGEPGNWGCHILDIPYWGLGLSHCTHVAGAGPQPDAQRTPKSLSSRLEFPATESRAAVTLHWSQAKGGPPILKELGLNGKGMNNLFIGSEGTMLCGFDKVQLMPEEKFKDFEPKIKLPKSPGFHKEWIEACRGGEPASCNFNYSGPMTESVLLANVAYRLQGEFAWDAAALKATSPSGVDVEPYLKPTFRAGWEIKG
jgi:predicted dehydrogenase